MDIKAQYRINPAHVVFEIAVNGERRTAWVSMDALAALAGCLVISEEQAIAAYRGHWRVIHAAALGLYARGQVRPFVRREDVV
jgi:hypothetical protein